MTQEKKYIEVLWYGRGGQGAITASQLVAEAAYLGGYRGVTTAPSFGAERRGAPVSAFLRLAHEPIRIFSPVTDPDVVVVLDPTLLPVIDIPGRFNRRATLVLNSTKSPDELNLGSFARVGTADITRVAVENKLTIAGVAILNTPILGAFVKCTGLVSIENIEKAITDKFPGTRADLNIRVARIIHEATRIYDHQLN